MPLARDISAGQNATCDQSTYPGVVAHRTTVTLLAQLEMTGVFRVGAARGRLHALTSFGLAAFLDDGATPHRWRVHDQADSSDAEPVS